MPNQANNFQDATTIESTVGPVQAGGGSGGNILTEDADRLLSEDGDFMIQE